MKWEMVRMNELCDIVRGSSPRPKGDPRYYGGEVPRLMIEDLTRDGKFVIPKVDSLTKEGALLSRPMQKGDLVITVSGRPGVPAILNIDACIHDGFVGIRNLNKKVDSNFLYWFLLKSKGSTNDQSVGAIFKNLTTDQIKDLQIPLPPLATQKRIAAILDAADALRRKDQALLQKYDELAQAIFVDMFGDPVKNEKGWEVKKLNDLCVTITDGTHQSPKFQKSGIPFLFVSNIRNNKIDYNTQTFISELDYGILAKRTPIEVGNILLTTVGATYGNPAIIEDERKFTFQRHIAFMKPKHDLVNYRYLFGILKDAYVKRQIDQRVNGAAQKTLNLSDLKEIKIWLPPRSLQDVYAKKLVIINKLKLICNKNRSETLFQSLLQKAFNAELVP